MTLSEEINQMKVDLYSFAERHSKVVDVYEAEKKVYEDRITKLEEYNEKLSDKLSLMNHRMNIRV